VGTDAAYNTIDLARLAPSPGDGTRLDAAVEPGRLDLGGQLYEVSGGSVPARLDVSRTLTGYALRLRFTAHVDGPCVRCLEHADVAVGVDAREVDQPAASDPDLDSPYVVDSHLDLASWAHDALALALPSQLLCRPECLGLCAVCGASLNDADRAEHSHPEAGGSPWAKLDELRRG
jgi:uncharacterized protein